MGEIIRVPLTGEVIGFNIDAAMLDNIGVSGNPSNPVKPINAFQEINVAWKLKEIDLENDEAVIEIFPPERTSDLKPGGNPDNPDDFIKRNTTAQEKQAEIDKAKAQLSKPKDQLYAESGEPKLKKLKKHVDDFKKYKDKKEIGN